MRIIDPTPTDPDVMPPMWCVVDGEERQDGTPLFVAWTDRREDAERIARALALTSPPSGARFDLQWTERGWRAEAVSDIVDADNLRKMAWALALELPEAVLNDVQPKVVAAAAEIERLRQVESLLIDQVTEADNDLGESVAISEGLCAEIERLRQVESLLIDQVTEAQMEAAHLRVLLAAANADAERLAYVMALVLPWMPSSAHSEEADCDCDTLMRDAIALHRERIGGAG